MPPTHPSSGDLLRFDAASWLLLVLLAGPPLALIGTAISALPGPLLVFTPLGVPVFLLLVAGEAALVGRLLPRLEPGTYAFPTHPQARAWALRFLLQRITLLAPWRPLVLGSTVLRAAMLRALGANVALSASTSSDVVITDPSLLDLGAGAMVGAQAALAGHLLSGGELRLGRVRIGEGAQVQVRAAVGPGCDVGEDAIVGADAALAWDVRVGRGAVVGARASLFPGVVVGEGAVIGHHAVLEARVQVGAFARVDAGAWVPRGTVVPEGGRFRAVTATPDPRRR